MATCLGLGSPGRCHRYSVMQEIIRLVDNEFLAILVIGDSTLLLKHMVLGFINKDILKDLGILVCHLVIAILYCSQRLA